MEGQTQLHKRDHHSTIIPDNITTQRNRKRRIKTPTIIKLILAIIFVSIWWLILNIYIMNSSNLQYEISTKDREIDPKHLEIDDVDERIAGIGEAVVQRIVDDIQGNGGLNQGLNPQQKKLDEEEEEDYDDDNLRPERPVPIENQQPNLGNGLNHGGQFIQGQNENQVVQNEPDKAVKEMDGLAEGLGNAQVQLLPIGQQEDQHNVNYVANGNAEEQNIQANFQLQNRNNIIQNNIQGFGAAGRINDDMHRGPLVNEQENIQDGNNDIGLELPDFDQGNQLDMNAGQIPGNGGDIQGLDGNMNEMNALQGVNQFGGQDAQVVIDGNIRNGNDYVLMNNNVAADGRVVQAADNFDDEDINPDQKVGERIAEIRQDEDGQLNHVQNEQDQQNLPQGIADQGNGMLQDGNERNIQDNDVNRVIQDDRQVENLGMVPDQDDMAHAQERMVQDAKLANVYSNILAIAKNDLMLKMLKAKAEEKKVKQAQAEAGVGVGQDDNLAQAQERMVQDDRLDQVQNMRPKESIDGQMVQDNQFGNDLNNNNVQNNALEERFAGQQDGVALNEEQMRQVQEKEARRHELLEKFKAFMDEQENMQDDQAMGNMNIERQRPAREKIRNLNVRTLPYDPNAPGEDGKGLKELPWEHDAVKKEWSKAEFNLYFSDKISLERTIPDGRPKKCSQKYYEYSSLPKTSIIICFTDEAWSPLLRTLHSIINRSPPELIEDIILVDDFSQSDDLKNPLEDYLRQFPQVKLLRLPSRYGLIRARLVGVEAARGPVLTFLDSHIEVNVGWLEPLLERIREDRTNVVAPVIDAIDAHTLAYVVANDRLRGGFSWVGLQFRWKKAPEDVWKARKDETEGVRSPTMAGGLFSIDKQYFIELGSYDPGLEIWGAENIELSLKIWMCGGQLEILPCSRVGHIFRSKQPYKFPSGSNYGTFVHNTLRVVNVWMDDEYKDVFYAVNPNLVDVGYGDVSDRVRLRELLQCQTFDWYVKNIYRDLAIPPADSVATGALTNLKSRWCLDKNGDDPDVAAAPCHGLGGNQAFRLTRQGILAVAEECVLGGDPRTRPLMEGPCSSHRVIHWQHSKNGVLKNKVTGLCLGVAADKKLAMMPCFQIGPHIQWTFAKYIDQKVMKADAL